MRTRKSQGNIVALWDIHDARQSASSPFGPLNPGSTTLLAQEIYRANQEARLMELLSSLESEVATLESKYCTVLDTLRHAIKDLRAVLSNTIEVEGGTEITCNECGDDLVTEGESKCLDCLEGMLQ